MLERLVRLISQKRRFLGSFCDFTLKINLKFYKNNFKIYNMVINKVGRGLKRLFGGTGSQTERPQERQLPPEGRQMPPAGPSRAPREGASVGTTAPSEEREFLTPPVEDVGPSIPRPSAEDWQPRLEPRPRGSPVDPQEEYDRLMRRRAALEERAGSGLRSFDPDHPPEQPIDWDFWGGPGSGWGDGRGPPPRGYGGPGPDGPEPGPSGFQRNIWLLLGLSISYAAYQWFLSEIREGGL